MQNVSNRPQAPQGNERGYPPQPPVSQEEAGAQSGGYQQQPYPPSYPGQQQQYWNQPWYSKWPPSEASPFERISMGMKARTAGVLCYLFGWVGGLVFLLLERDNRFVRFHAAQSILFFGAISVLGWICSFFPFGLFGLGGVVGLVGFIGWIVLMVAAHHGRYYKLPLFGDYAEQLAGRVTV